MEDAQRLRIMYRRRARRYFGARREASTRSGRYPAWKALHRCAQRCSGTDAEGERRPVVSQAFCSALPVAYTRIPATHWKPFASMVLEAAYEPTMLAAVLNKQRGASNIVLLTLLGGGAFGNEDDWIHGAIRRALKLVSGFELDCTAC